MQNYYDVVIVGAGIAGLYTAVNIKSNLKILVVSKSSFEISNSSLAQGGIAAVTARDDTLEDHINDTLKAGSFKNNIDALSLLIKNAPNEIKKLIEYGVDFDKLDTGEYHLTIEGGHTKRRILHNKDTTGKEIISKLINYTSSKQNIQMMSQTTLFELNKDENNFIFSFLNDENQILYTQSKICILATGGIGRALENSTNSEIATGDGIVYASQLGAKIEDLDLIQIHPTAFKIPGKLKCFLISEAVRGEGAHLLNNNKERFMHNYHPQAELAPRDVVSSSIFKESQKTNSKNFYIDISHKESKFIKERFPMIYNSLIELGYDLTKDLIPIYPCQHYLMGGIKVNLSGKTSVENLYAVGECSNTGVHGNNRLASNSLSEAIVFGNEASKDINLKFDSITQKEILTILKSNSRNMYSNKLETLDQVNELIHFTHTIRNILQTSIFNKSDIYQIKINFEKICKIKQQIKTKPFQITKQLIETKSILEISYLIIKEIILKYESN